MMRDKDLERGINSGKSGKEISCKKKIKKSERRDIGRRDININNCSLSKREKERE